MNQSMAISAPRPRVKMRERLYTAADLAMMPSEVPSGTMLYELDNGRLISLPPHDDAHGAVEGSIVGSLYSDGEQAGNGKVRCGGTGVVLWRNPDRVVGADALFVANASLPIRRSPEGYLETIPDLVLEVVSRNDTRAYIQRKVDDYLAAGVRIVWVADPQRQTITIHRPGAAPEVLGVGDMLTAGEVIPGFRMPVADAFRE